MLLKLARRASWASLSPVGVFLLRFLRIVIVSRLLSPADLGAAVALLSILAIAEMVTDVGLDRFVLLAKGGDRAQAAAAARQVALGRAALLACGIAVGAPWLARLFGAGEHAGTIACLGAIPLIAALRNWRVVQLQQDYRYGPEAVASIGGQVAAVLAVVPAALWFGDSRAMLVSLLAEAVANVTLTRLLAPGEKVDRVDPAMRRAALGFGLPLMANGLGLAAMKQFDQVVVAGLFGLEALAHYSLSLNLAIVPTSLLQIIVQKLGLPFLVNADSDPGAARRAPLGCVLGFAALGAVYAVAIALLLDVAVPLIYGERYRADAAFCAVAAFDVFLRLSRGGPNMILLHQGRTRVLMLGNLVAGIGIPLGLLLASHSGRTEGVVAGLAAGDLASLVALLALLRGNLAWRPLARHLAVLAAIVAAAAAVPWALAPPSPGLRLAVAALAAAALALDGLALYRRVGRFFVERSRRPAAPPLALAETGPGPR